MKRLTAIPACRLGLGVALAALLSHAHGAPATDILPPKNSYIADSFNAMPHKNPGQVDSTLAKGPVGPTRRLSAKEIRYADDIGLGHLGFNVSSPYRDGRRVMWTRGNDRIVKMDYETFEVLATYPLPGKEQVSFEQARALERQLSALEGEARLKFAIEHAATFLGTGLEGTYTLLDRDGNFYMGTKRGLRAYGDEKPGDPTSKIVVRRTWEMPDSIAGSPIGLNMTYDGWLVMATDGGDLLLLSRDFTRFHTIKLKHSDEAAAYNAAIATQKRVGYGWVRNSFAVDPAGGIYIASNNWMHKVVWTGERLSIDEADGAWTERYANSTGTGTGSTPALMGFGDADQFVVMTDGDTLMNVNLFWRNQVPADAKPLPGESPRLAGKLPVNLCDKERRALQSEQAVVVGGYGAFVVNNEPASVPLGLPKTYQGLLISLLGDQKAYTPHGMQKFEWDPQQRQLRMAWCNKDVASPSAVPFVSLTAEKIYTSGVRNGEWTLEGIDINSGESAFHYLLGAPRYNANFAGVTIDDQGRPIYGTLFGLMRLDVPQQQ